MGPRAARFLIPTSLSGAFDVIHRTCPTLAYVVNVSLYPSELLLELIQALELPPHGCAGFIWFLIVPGLQWIIIGVVCGAILAIFPEPGARD